MIPIRRRRAIPKEEVLAIFATAPVIDANELRADLDAVIGQDLREARRALLRSPCDRRCGEAGRTGGRTAARGGDFRLASVRPGRSALRAGVPTVFDGAPPPTSP